MKSIHMIIIQKAFLLIEFLIYLTISVLMMSMVMRTVATGWRIGMERYAHADMVLRMACAYDLIVKDISVAPYQKKNWIGVKSNRIVWQNGTTVIGYRYTRDYITRISGQWDMQERKMVQANYSKIASNVGQCVFAIDMNNNVVRGVTVTITMKKGRSHGQIQQTCTRYIPLYNGPIGG